MLRLQYHSNLSQVITRGWDTCSNSDKRVRRARALVRSDGLRRLSRVGVSNLEHEELQSVGL